MFNKVEDQILHNGNRLYATDVRGEDIIFVTIGSKAAARFACGGYMLIIEKIYDI